MQPQAIKIPYYRELSTDGQKGITGERLQTLKWDLPKEMKERTSIRDPTMDQNQQARQNWRGTWK